MTHSDQRAPTPSSSLDHVIQESSADTIHMRLGLLVAVLAHVVLFAANWPSFARSATPAPEKQLPIVVLRHFTYTIPPTPPPEAPIRRQVELIPVPDPRPHDPEPLPRENDVVWEIDPGDWVPREGLEIPAPPPDIVQQVLPRVGTEITAPRRIVTVEPIYPEIARRAHKEGAVVLSLIIGPEGKVDSIEVLRGLPLGLTEAAVTAAQQWIFEPSTYNGRPTSVQYILTVRFALS